MYRNVTEIAALLAEKYDGPTEEREGAGGRTFTYIPWTVTVRRLNDTFGPFGWSTTAPHSYYANGAYNVEFGLTVTVEDDKGTLFTKTVPAQGQAIARGESDDNALKSAQSDALSRGSKLLGDYFGFHLYEERPAARTQTNTAARTNTGSKGPSEKQRGVLKGMGFSAEDIDGMTYATWKGHLDEHFASKNNTQAPF